jgi:hypothetical protein
MVITPAMARTAMGRCGKVAAEKPVVAMTVCLAEAALPPMIDCGGHPVLHTCNIEPRVTDEHKLEFYL